MTKGELIRFLEPFDDDIQIIVRASSVGDWREVLGSMYGQRSGEGLACLVLGDAVVPPQMVTSQRTAAE